MTFIAPALLALGIAVTVPLVLHLLQRHQGPRMVFPALRYLQRAEREHATRIRIRQVLLLVLRVLAILLLAAAAARPFLAVGGDGHAPTSVVLVLDNSLSTGAVVGDRRVLDELRAAALATLDAAGPDDRVWLIRAGRPWEPAITGAAAAVAEAVRRTEPTGASADIAAELERGESILAGEPADRAREIHLFTDLQSTAWRGVRPRGDGPALRVFRPSTPPPANRAIRDVEVGGGLAPRAGERSTVAVTVESSDAGDSTGVRLVVDGSVRAAAIAPPAAAPGGAAVVLPFPARSPGRAIGHVEVDADALTADDRRHFVVAVRPPAAVALTDPLPFLTEALQVLEEAGRLRRAPVGAAEVIIAPGADGAAEVRRGAAVVVLPPSSPLELAAANQRLAAAGLPVRYGPPGPGEARLSADGSGLEGVLPDVRLRQVYRLETGADGAAPDTVLLRLRSGEPWAVAGAGGDGGRWVALATPLTPEAGTLPTSAAMLPLLDRALTAWAAGTSERAEHRPGDVVAIGPADAMIRPDGERTAVSGSVARLEEPGVYRAVRDGETVAAYAVNPAPEESDLTRIDPERLASLLTERDAEVADAGRWPDVVFHRRLGQEATLPLVGALLLLLVVESVVAATGRGRPR